MRIPATSRRNPTDPDKIRTQPAKKYCKILSKSAPGESPEPPESVRDSSGTRPSDENTKKKIGGKNTTEHFCRERFFVIVEVRPGAQNRQKTSPEPKKCARRRRRTRLLSFFLAGAVRSRSPIRFWDSLTLENYAPTTAGARF